MAELVLTLNLPWSFIVKNCIKIVAVSSGLIPRSSWKIKVVHGSSIKSVLSTQDNVMFATFLRKQDFFFIPEHFMERRTSGDTFCASQEAF